MKKLLLSVLLLSLFSGCSNEPPSIELVKDHVELVPDDKNYSLKYSFVLRNTGSKSVGSRKEENSIDIKIVPDEELKRTSEDVFDKNIYDEIYLQNGAFVGTPTSKQLTWNLPPNKESEYSISYYLGPYEAHEKRRVPRSQKQIEQLEKYARKATLVVLVKDQEVARFELKGTSDK